MIMTNTEMVSLFLFGALIILVFTLVPF